MLTIKPLKQTTSAISLANKFFPEHTSISERYYQDYLEAFYLMDKKVINSKTTVINDSVWSFELFGTVFFCICLNPGEWTEQLYFGLVENNPN
jgi:hypothetical protein